MAGLPGIIGLGSQSIDHKTEAISAGLNLLSQFGRNSRAEGVDFWMSSSSRGVMCEAVYCTGNLLGGVVLAIVASEFFAS